MDLAAKGLTDLEIASALSISPATVSTYWGRVRMKVGPFNRAELVARYVQSQSEDALTELRDANRALAERLHTLSEGESADHVTLLHRRALSHAADGIVLVSVQGVIEMVNQSCATMFGYTPAELEGRSINCLIPEDLRSMHDRHRDEFLDSPSKRQMGEPRATIGIRKDGSKVPIVATIAAFDVDGVQYVVCSLRETGPATPS